MHTIACGVDSLYVSFGGKLEESLLGALEALKSEAQAESGAVPVSFEEGRATVVQPYGWGFYRYWIHCTDFELHIARSEHVPPVYVRLSSMFLHSRGPEAAVAEVEAFVRASLLTPAKPATVSRIDLYSDFQGWEPVASDIDRFVTRSVHNELYFEPVQGHQAGRRFSGFRFGRDQLVARLYEKSHEITQSGKDWMHEVWAQRYEPALPVWRLEFQFRREVVGDFNLAAVGEVLACRQDLWDYAMRWLSLRVVGETKERDRWPLDPRWEQLAWQTFGVPVQGILRRRYRERQELLLVRGLSGYLTSHAALVGVRDYDRALGLASARVKTYIKNRGQTFSKLVADKRLRLV